jgi:hypothetical protein
MAYAALLAAALLAIYVLISYAVYRRAFVPGKPKFLDDFTFTPFEFQADSEEVELVTADGVSFGAWHLRQPWFAADRDRWAATRGSAPTRSAFRGPVAQGFQRRPLFVSRYARQRLRPDHLRYQGGAQPQQ